MPLRVSTGFLSRSRPGSRVGVTPAALECGSPPGRRSALRTGCEQVGLARCRASGRFGSRMVVFSGHSDIVCVAPATTVSHFQRPAFHGVSVRLSALRYFPLSLALLPVAAGSAWADPAPGAAVAPLAPRELLTSEQVRRFRRAAETLSSSSDKGALFQAMQVLRREFPATRPFLEESSRGGSARVRAFCVRVLGERGTVAEDLATVERGLSDPAVSVRLAALAAVGRLGPEGYPALAGALKAEVEPRLRRTAVATLERWREPRAVALLVGLLEQEEDPLVLPAIVRALQATTGKRLGGDAAAWRALLAAEETSTRNRKLYRELQEDRARKEVEGK